MSSTLTSFTGIVLHKKKFQCGIFLHVTPITIPDTKITIPESTTDDESIKHTYAVLIPKDHLNFSQCYEAVYNGRFCESGKDKSEEAFLVTESNVVLVSKELVGQINEGDMHGRISETIIPTFTFTGLTKMSAEFKNQWHLEDKRRTFGIEDENRVLILAGGSADTDKLDSNDVEATLLGNIQPHQCALHSTKVFELIEKYRHVGASKKASHTRTASQDKTCTDPKMQFCPKLKNAIVQFGISADVADEALEHEMKMQARNELFAPGIVTKNNTTISDLAVNGFLDAKSINGLIECHDEERMYLRKLFSEIILSYDQDVCASHFLQKKCVSEETQKKSQHMCRDAKCKYRHFFVLREKNMNHNSTTQSATTNTNSSELTPADDSLLIDQIKRARARKQENAERETKEMQELFLGTIFKSVNNRQTDANGELTSQSTNTEKDDFAETLNIASKKFVPKTARHMLFAKWIVHEKLLKNTNNKPESASSTPSTETIFDATRYPDSNLLTDAQKDTLKSKVIIDVAGGSGALAGILREKFGIKNVFTVDPALKGFLSHSHGDLQKRFNAKYIHWVTARQKGVPMTRLIPDFFRAEQLITTSNKNIKRTSHEEASFQKFSALLNNPDSAKFEECVVLESEESDSARSIGSTDEHGSIATLKYLLQNNLVDLIVGMHADEPTEDILKVAEFFEIPAAVVPCCVFSKRGFKNKVKNSPADAVFEPKERSTTKITNYWSFCKFLFEHYKCEGSILPVQGKNMVLHTERNS